MAPPTSSPAVTGAAAGVTAPRSASTAPPAGPHPYRVALAALGLDPAWHAAWPERRYALAVGLALALLVDVGGLRLDEAARRLGYASAEDAARHLGSHRALLSEVGPLGEAYERAFAQAASAYERGALT